MDKTVVSIVENLQIFVKDIHFRFEDAISNKIPFSFGLTIDHASFESCNSSYEKGGKEQGKTGEARSIVYKVRIRIPVLAFISCLPYFSPTFFSVL